MKKRYILSLDQGTTGTRAFLFDRRGRVIAGAYREFKQYFPKPGWVEHDAEEIWASCVAVIRRAMSQARISAGDIAAIGITNQRETTVLWDRRTSRPVHRAIVWQCRRTAQLCEQLKKKSLEKSVRHKTGLILDPYFSGTKVKWLLDHVPGLRALAQNGSLCFGTMDTWLIWKLTGGSAHVTDYTNASRTLLFNIRTLKWDTQILKQLNIPAAVLPSVQNSGSRFGVTSPRGIFKAEIPILAVMGDQQSALYGQGCFSAGTIKNTYGTGCFLVLNTNKKLIYSKEGLLSTIACDERGRPVYALEGAVFIAGAVIQWLRDELKLLKTSADSETIIQGLKDTGGVYLVPAFTGLGAPYWRSDARGLISGITRGTRSGHLVRAGLEAIAYQTRDVFDLMQRSLGKKIKTLRVDGGACRNDFLMQFQADILDCEIVRPAMIESTAQGAAYLAGVTAGLWKAKTDFRKLQRVEKIFRPNMSKVERRKLYAGWIQAVKKALI